MEKSVVLPAFFPKTMNSPAEFKRVIDILKEYDISTVEFYYQGESRESIGEILTTSGFNSVFLGAMLSKREKLNLSSLEEKRRKYSVKKMKECIDSAYYFGSRSLLINSGMRPEDSRKHTEAYKQLKKSIKELLVYTVKSTKEEYILQIVLEPGDTEIDSCELIGHTEQAVKLAQDISKDYSNFGLTLDTSHLRQLNEDPISSIKKAYSYCNHIHLANCIIKDRSSELYGDKHPVFSINKGEFSVDNIQDIYEEIIELYEGKGLTIGMEIICREKDNYRFFTKEAKNLKWFYDREV